MQLMSNIDAISRIVYKFGNSNELRAFANGQALMSFMQIKYLKA